MLIKWFDEISQKDLSLVGGKNASLGEMISKLKNKKLPVPFGFALTTEAYKSFLTTNKLGPEISKILEKCEIADLAQLSAASLDIKELIKNADFAHDLNLEIKTAYEKLVAKGKGLRVAVRSSASAEDLPHASFAGQQDTYLHVASFEEVMSCVKDVYISMFGERAIAYRAHHHFDHMAVHMSVGIQEMVASDLGVSGVMFTLDPESGFKGGIFINASYGLGESVVSGAVNPDEFMLSKRAIKEQKLVVLNKKLGSKKTRLRYEQSGKIVEENILEAQRQQYCLSDSELFSLATMALTIEEHYGRPMDIEWAKDGNTGELFILQARPETVHSQAQKNQVESFFLINKSKVLCSGRAVGKRIAQGQARVLRDLSEAKSFKEGEVLVTDMTDPNWEPVMQKASAVVTNRGGRTCHAAIIARELGIAAVVGCDDATKKIADNTLITVSCAEGEDGLVYEGLLEIGKKQQNFNLNKNHQPPLMLIAGNPSKALSYHELPHQGIGLARLEFIIANLIGIHPNAILAPENMPAPVKEQILAKARLHESPQEFYIDTLQKGLMTLGEIAHPHPVIVRLSDFKTNEYEELLGGQFFEQKENNPMLGFRGAARYLSKAFKPAFAMEASAIVRAREEGYKNIQVMVPFVRTLNEAEQVVKLLAEHGLKRDENLKLIMMCEVPSNAILAQEFLQYFDGFSIGSNDLTQLSLGVDRDSHLVASQFKENDLAVLKLIKMAIKACKEQKKYVGICGQGPSDDIDFARWLLEEKIDSISLSPDTLLDTYLQLN